MLPLLLSFTLATPLTPPTAAGGMCDWNTHCSKDMECVNSKGEFKSRWFNVFFKGTCQNVAIAGQMCTKKFSANTPGLLICGRNLICQNSICLQLVNGKPVPISSKPEFFGDDLSKAKLIEKKSARVSENENAESENEEIGPNAGNSDTTEEKSDDSSAETPEIKEPLNTNENSGDFESNNSSEVKSVGLNTEKASTDEEKSDDSSAETPEIKEPLRKTSGDFESNNSSEVESVGLNTEKASTDEEKSEDSSAETPEIKEPLRKTSGDFESNNSSEVESVGLNPENASTGEEKTDESSAVAPQTSFSETYDAGVHNADFYESSTNEHVESRKNREAQAMSREIPSSPPMQHKERIKCPPKH